jgi:RHS repeat-associated protein
MPLYKDDEEESDTFILSGSEDLVPVLVQVGGQWQPDTFPRVIDGIEYRIKRYRPRIEGLFARIERWTRKSDGDIHWRSISKDNVTTIYGKTAESRIADPNTPSNIFSWLVCESYDDKGNAIIYEYVAENSDNVNYSFVHERNRTEKSRSANRYLKRIKYGNKTSRLVQPDLSKMDWMFEVVFDYGEHDVGRPKPKDSGKWLCRYDPFSSYRAGFEIRAYRLCQRVLMFHHFPEEEGVGKDCLVRSTDFVYRNIRNNPEDLRKGHPVASFIGSVTQSGYKRRATDGSYGKKSLPPLEFEYSRAVINEEIREIDDASLENLPYGVDGIHYRWVDLDGEGISGILTGQADGWFYKQNLGGGKFGPLDEVKSKPSLAALESGRQQLLDIAGDGQLDLVDLSAPTPGFYERTNDRSWERFISFASIPNIAWDDPNLRFVDLTGDGHADVLITEDEVFAWYHSLAEEGFRPPVKVPMLDDEEKGPRLVFADGIQSIYLADMSGDGLVDLVRIRNGQVCYWPNLGYGRFGAKVTMDNPPWFDAPDLFDQKHIRLADIDGSGVTDIIYLGSNGGVRLYFNQSGNSWSDAHTLAQFPKVDNLSSVTVLDLLGNGTACLVWSSNLPGRAVHHHPMRYIDLMGGQKPHLMTVYTNGLGKEVRLEYKPSTFYYLADKKAGNPWITRLPFPVQCVNKVTVKDHIRETVFVTSFTYHHGYYDGIEREFRGFGRVDKLDTETYNHFKINSASNVVEEPLHQPPVLVKTWFHTGAFLEDLNQILHQFSMEYYRNESVQEYHLPEPSIPAGLTNEEYREALRACKGLTLRQEIYAIDGAAQARHPYLSIQSSYLIRSVQPMKENRHASFLITPSETISFYYERNADDPRVSHTLVLESDDLGLVRKSAAVSYPRRKQDMTLPVEVHTAQAKMYVVYTETDYTNDIMVIDAYRRRTVYENRTYELTGMSIPEDTLYLTREAILDAVNNAEAVPFEILPSSSGMKKRLVSHTRTLFLRDDLGGPLPLGSMEKLRIPYQTFRLAFTRGLATQQYGAKITDMQFAQAGYVHSEGDSDWWLKSGTAVFSSAASSHFYLPLQFHDPLGTTTTIEYDVYDLLIKSVTDAIGNQVSAENDYRTLSPVEVTDANLNRSAVEIDELGMVVKSALMGKSGDGDGDTLDDPTARVEYDMFNWHNNRKPVYGHTFGRERHGAANPRWQEQYIYFDGGGNQIMVKSQAKPGKAKRWNETMGKVEEIDTSPSIRWVGNGRTILNNKGNPVKQYEPYFSATHDFETARELVEIGFTPILYYDPIGRNIRVDFPNGTFSCIEIEAWSERRYDANDTVLESHWYSERGSPDPSDPEPADPERRAAWLAAKHANTPMIIYSDILGRKIFGLADNGTRGKYRSRTEMDLTGHFAKAYDAKDRLVMSVVTNLIGWSIYSDSAEKGKRWVFTDALGNLVTMWDERQRIFHITYDQLHRPVNTLYQEGHDAEIVFNRVVYGDHHRNAADLNLRGRIYQIYGQSGVVTLQNFDFKGNPVTVERRFALEYRQLVDWNPIKDLTDVATIETAAAILLENELFTGTSSYDALNRPIRVQLPDQTVVEPRFNESNFLDSLRVQIRGQGGFITFLVSQDYNAKGQRQFAKYGNNTITKYFYDPKSYRLVNLLTKKEDEINDDNSLQNLKYTYDPVGNITLLTDEAQQTHFFRNSVVKPENQFEYDAIYQLIKATGREHAGIGGNVQRDHSDIPYISNLPHPNDSNAVRTYTEEYEYDELGNILKMQHIANGGSWTRRYRYTYQDDSTDRTNRLKATSLPSDSPGGSYSAVYSYDTYGNMTSMPHLASMDWNFMDQLKIVDLGGGGKAYYVYGNSGQRIRKVIERNGTTRIERIYLGAVEVYRKRQSGTLKLERWTVHIADDTGRIAQVETKSVDLDGTDAAPRNTPITRYQYTNHLGSAVLETDDAGNPISYEEYHPYGTTSYHSSKSGINISLKRYRYAGKEQDDETGLYYFGMRYYAAWLGRWTSSDPGGFVRGFNLFRYCSNNPIMFHDPNGMQDRRFGLPDVSLPENPTQAQIDRAAGRLQRHVHGLGYQWSRNGSSNPAPIYRGEEGWYFGTFDPEHIPAGDPLGLLRSSESPTATSGGGEGDTTVSNPVRVGQTAVNSANQPRAPSGEVLEGSLNLWSGDEAAAQAAEGYVLRDTAHQSDIEDEVARARASRGRNLDWKTEERPIWSEGSRQLAREGALAQRGVRSHGLDTHPNPAGTIQAEIEIPTVRRWGSGMAALGGLSGGLTIYSASQVENDTIRYIGYTAGAGEIGGAATYGTGLTLLGRTASSARVMSIGAGIGRFTGGPGMVVLSTYSLVNNIQNENYGVVLGDSAGIVAGAGVIAGSGPVAAVAGGVAVTNMAGDWVESAVTPTYGRGAGVASGTLAGAGAGAAIGAAVGVWFFGVGAGVGAAVGGVIGGIAGFIGAFW